MQFDVYHSIINNREYWNQSWCARRSHSHSRTVNQIFEIRNHKKSHRAQCRSFAYTQLLRSIAGRSRLRRVRFLSPATQRFPRGKNKRSDSLREKMKRLLGIFVLSKNEQRVVLIVMLVLLAVA